MQINFQYSPYYLFLVALTAILLSWWLYASFKKKYEAASLTVAFLSVFRGVTILLLGFLILVPFVRLIKSTLEKPVLAIGFDNSGSISINDSQIINLVGSKLKGLKKELNDEFDIESFVFGDDVAPGEWDLSDKKSNINQWLKFVGGQYKHSNLAGVITVSDGIFNAGGNPIYSGYTLNAPLYNIALGDTNAPIDARISYINNNDIAYKGNQFPIRVGVAVEKLKGSKLSITLSKEGKVIEKKEISVTTDDLFAEISFLADAESVGIQKYSIALSESDNEISTSNNYQQVFVEVIDADKNILILYDAPHPDIAAIRKSIERSRNYALDLYWVNDPNRENLITEFDKYHLIIYHNLPKGNLNVVEKAFSSSASQFFIADNSVNFQYFNRSQDLLQVKLKSAQANEVTSSFNKLFVSFSLDKTQMAQLSEFPPLKAAFVDIDFANSSDVILRQKIGSVETNYPLLVTSQSGSKKVGVLPATGIWRWFLYEYSKNENNKGLDELFNQTMQYLSVKDDKRRLRLNTNKFLFDENEDVTLNASFYDKNYQVANNAIVEAKIKDANGKEYQFAFVSKGGIYELNAGQFGPGEYTYVVSAALGDDKHQVSGTFTVAEVNIEFMQPVANHNLLFQLADANGGALYYPSELDKLIDEIRNNELAKPVRHDKAEITELIHNKWFFILLLLLLTLEWSIRKYKGSY